MRLLTLLAAMVLIGCAAPEPEPLPALEVEPEPVVPSLDPPRSWRAISDVIRPGDTLAGALIRMGVDGVLAGDMVRGFSEVFNVRHIRPGDGVRVVLEEDAPTLLEFRRGPVEEYLVRKEADRWVGSPREFQIESEVVRVEGTLESSLSEALHAVGEDSRLVVALADVLAWDVDFYLDPRKGDSFQIVVEKRVHEGKTVGYGEILAAEYRGEVTGLRRVFLYPNPKTGNPEYYAQDGSSAQRTFLKSPLKFAYISSGYGGRIHPTLKYYKQHQGVDYAAATGTPVWAIGDGVVTKAGWGGACGNMVTLRHSNGLETVYCHFSKIASGVRVGTRIPQKQVIGFVGATGRATGPHLHFGMLRGGSFINPLTLKMPPADPLPASEIPQFEEAIASFIEDLEGGYLASAEKETEVVGP